MTLIVPESIELARPAGLAVMVGFARVAETAVATRRGEAVTSRPISHLEEAREAGAGMVSVGPGVPEVDPLLVDAYARAGRGSARRSAREHL